MAEATYQKPGIAYPTRKPGRWDCCQGCGDPFFVCPRSRQFGGKQPIGGGVKCCRDCTHHVKAAA